MIAQDVLLEDPQQAQDNEDRITRLKIIVGRRQTIFSLQRLVGRLKRRMSDQTITAIDEVLAARHDVAHHGKPTSLTYGDLRGDKRDKGYYYQLVEAIRIIDGLFPKL